MKIVKSSAESNGAYAYQSWEDGASIPDGYIAVPPELVSACEQYAPFFVPTVADGTITAIADNPDARAADAATHMAVVTAPNIEDRVAALESAMLTQLG